MNTKQAVKGLIDFYNECEKGQSVIDSLANKFWISANYASSTFMKFYVGDNKTKVDIYRDDARGGEYFLRKSLILH